MIGKKIKMEFMDCYVSPKSGNTNLVFSEKKVSQEEVDSVKEHNEKVRSQSVTTSFGGQKVETYGSFKQVESGNQVIVPLKKKYNWTPEQLTELRSKKHPIIVGEPITYSSGNKSTFRYLGKLDV